MGAVVAVVAAVDAAAALAVDGRGRRRHSADPFVVEPVCDAAVVGVILRRLSVVEFFLAPTSTSCAPTPTIITID